MSFLDKFGLGKKSPSVVGIDIGSAFIKVVQLRLARGKAVLETYGAIALGPYAELAVGQATNLSVEQTIKALKDLFREASITTTHMALSIPLRSSLVEVIELPTFDKDKLNQMIPLEARKYIPVPISEVALDWWIIPDQHFRAVEDASTEKIPIRGDNEKLVNKSRVLVVAIHNATIKKFQDIATGSGLSLGTFEVEVFSGIRALLNRDITTSAILDIGASASKLSIVDYGIVQVAHIIDRGAQDITIALSRALSIPFAQAEEAKRREGLTATSHAVGISSTVTGESSNVASSVLEYIFHEASRVVIDYEKRRGRLVNRIILVGGGATLAGILPLAQKSFETEVVLGDPFYNVTAPPFLQEILSQAGPEFTTAIGLALRELNAIAG